MEKQIKIQRINAYAHGARRILKELKKDFKI